jgi:hypothetical protein
MNHFYILISWVQIYFCISDFAFLIYKYIVTTSSLCDDLNNSNVYKKYFHKYLQINIDIINNIHKQCWGYATSAL